MLFQFLVVRLEGSVVCFFSLYPGFQFLVVRLEDGSVGFELIDKLISIPCGAIRSFHFFCR